jgi:hypothetical protein
MNIITVTITNKYGQERIYPACPKAELFCEIARSKTLTRADIDHIKALGFSVNVTQEVTKL